MEQSPYEVLSDEWFNAHGIRVERPEPHHLRVIAPPEWNHGAIKVIFDLMMRTSPPGMKIEIQDPKTGSGFGSVVPPA